MESVAVVEHDSQLPSRRPSLAARIAAMIPLASMTTSGSAGSTLVETARAMSSSG